MHSIKGRVIRPFHLPGLTVCYPLFTKLWNNGLRLGSLRLLTLASFAFALLPLAVLLWQTQHTLSEFGQLASHQANEAVELTRSVEAMQSAAVDIERLVRQYRVLKNAELVTIIQRYRRQFNLDLAKSCTSTTLQPLCNKLSTSLPQITRTDSDLNQTQFDALLKGFHDVLNAFSRLSASQLDNNLAKQQQYIQHAQQQVTWQTIILTAITLLLVWLASQVVVSPMAKLEKLIRAIGHQNTELPELSFKYPHEMVELDQRLRWLAGRLADLESTRHTLLRHASHELKTPLASIREGCSLLRDEVVGPLNGKQQEVAGLLDISAKRLTQLVEQLLDYNRLLQQSEVRPEWFNSEDFITEICAQHQLAVEQNGQFFEVNLSVDRVYADKQLLQRIVDNLINNAVAYGLRNTPLTIVLAYHDQQLELRVSNACSKQSSDDPIRLLEPFQRGGQARNDGLSGSGLGLSIVAECAKMMNGSVKLISDAQPSFTVQVSLPMQEE